MTAAIVFLALWATLAIGKGTPIGRFLCWIMVEMSAAAVGRLGRVDVVAAIVILMLIVLHFSAGDADPVRLVSLFAPDLAMWLASVEISILIDAAAGLAALWATLRRVNVRDVLPASVFGLAERGKGPKNHGQRGRRHRHIPAANDDEDGVELAIAS